MPRQTSKFGFERTHRSLIKDINFVKPFDDKKYQVLT